MILTDDSRAIVAEIEADCVADAAAEWSDDAMLAAIHELDLPCERCAMPATGFSAGAITCDDCALIVSREHYGPIDTIGELDDVLFPDDGEPF